MLPLLHFFPPPLSSQYTNNILSNTHSPLFDVMGLYRSAFNLSLLAALAAVLVPWAAHLVKVGGLFLTPNPTELGEGQGPIYIEDTVHCEDVHHYLPANLLFTACEDSKSTRFDWFPGLGHFTPRPEARGSIHVVNPQVS